MSLLPLRVCVCMRVRTRSLAPRFSWRYQLREFKSEFRVVAVDMRGYGESDLPLSVDSYRFEHLVTDVKDIVEYLGEACDSGDSRGWGGTAPFCDSSRKINLFAVRLCGAALQGGATDIM